MNKKNKGFTLIELLAIIVILAIIAVITVPIILNVIDNAKKGTAKDSAYGYKDAINKYYVSGMLEDESIKLSGDYNVVNGKLGEYDIPFSGTKPTSGYLTFENNALTSGCLTIDEYKVTFLNGEVTEVEVGECENVIEIPQEPDTPTDPETPQEPDTPTDPETPQEPDTPTEPETPQVTYKCKRADVETLHIEECKQTSTSSYCSGAGYTTSNEGTTITYGNTEVTRGTLKSGDAFDCDVDGDGKYSSDTERFYYVSDLYNTTTKQFDDKYAVLIFYNNFANGNPDNKSSSKVAYNSYTDNDNPDGINYNGPVTAITYLPTTSMWTNVTLSNTTRAILNPNGEGTSNLGEKNLPTEFSYEGYAARLITFQEISSACIGNLPSIGTLESCVYLMENTKFSNSSLGSYGYWIETPRASGDVHRVNGSGRNLHSNFANYTGYNGVRPAIEVLKTDIEY